MAGTRSILGFPFNKDQDAAWLAEFLRSDEPPASKIRKLRKRRDGLDLMGDIGRYATDTVCALSAACVQLVDGIVSEDSYDESTIARLVEKYHTLPLGQEQEIALKEMKQQFVDFAHGIVALWSVANQHAAPGGGWHQPAIVADSLQTSAAPRGMETCLHGSASHLQQGSPSPEPNNPDPGCGVAAKATGPGDPPATTSLPQREKKEHYYCELDPCPDGVTEPFIRYSDFTKHMDKHNRPYMCPECDYGFTKKNHLNRHANSNKHPARPLRP